MLTSTPDIDKGLDDLLVLSLPYILYCENHRNELVDHVIGAIQAHTESNKFGFKRKELAIRDYIDEIDLSDNETLDIRRLQSFLVSNSEVVKELLYRVTVLENSKKDSKRDRQKNSTDILESFSQVDKTVSYPPQKIVPQKIVPQKIVPTDINSNVNILPASVDITSKIKSENYKIICKCLSKSGIPLSAGEISELTGLAPDKIGQHISKLRKRGDVNIVKMTWAEYKLKYGKLLAGGTIAYYIEEK